MQMIQSDDSVVLVWFFFVYEFMSGQKKTFLVFAQKMFFLGFFFLAA